MTTSLLSQIGQQLFLFHLVSDKQKEFQAVLDVYVNADPQSPNEEILNHLEKEEPSVELSYCDEKMKVPIIFLQTKTICTS